MFIDKHNFWSFNFFLITIIVFYYLTTCADWIYTDFTAMLLTVRCHGKEDVQRDCIYFHYFKLGNETNDGNPSKNKYYKT